MHDIDTKTENHKLICSMGFYMQWKYVKLTISQKIHQLLHEKISL